jgi:hypothetical protein
MPSPCPLPKGEGFLRVLLWLAVDAGLNHPAGNKPRREQRFTFSLACPSEALGEGGREKAGMRGGSCQKNTQWNKTRSSQIHDPQVRK